LGGWRRQRGPATGVDGMEVGVGDEHAGTEEAASPDRHGGSGADGAPGDASALPDGDRRPWKDRGQLHRVVHSDRAAAARGGQRDVVADANPARTVEGEELGTTEELATPPD